MVLWESDRKRQKRLESSPILCLSRFYSIQMLSHFFLKTWSERYESRASRLMKDKSIFIDDFRLFQSERLCICKTVQESI